MSWGLRILKKVGSETRQTQHLKLKKETTPKAKDHIEPRMWIPAKTQKPLPLGSNVSHTDIETKGQKAVQIKKLSKKNMPQKLMAVKMAYYKKEDWENFLVIIDDRQKMHDTWDGWHEAYLELKNHLISEGFEVIDREVDLNELATYCSSKGIKIDGKARSQFVQEY